MRHRSIYRKSACPRARALSVCVCVCISLCTITTYELNCCLDTFKIKAAAVFPTFFPFWCSALFLNIHAQPSQPAAAEMETAQRAVAWIGSGRAKRAVPVSSRRGTNADVRRMSKKRRPIFMKTKRSRSIGRRSEERRRDPPETTTRGRRGRGETPTSPCNLESKR